MRLASFVAAARSRIGACDSATLRRCTESWPTAVASLVAVNFVVFGAHYKGEVDFPWDFPLSYYAFTAYWTTAVGEGIRPEWMPFQQMGYPFLANLQTGIGYPPFWVFPIADIPYTMHAAVVFQVLHVLWGAIGAYWLGRLLFGAGVPALFLGLCYHFFGGFYTNAQHPDIVRAFAWLPWLIYAVHMHAGQRRLEPRNLALPFVVALTIGASYPGNIASHLLVAGFYVVALFLRRDRPAIWLLPASLGLVLVGVGLCMPFLGPGWMFKGLLTRATSTIGPRMNWPLANWAYLVLPWRRETPFVHDMSMLSAFVPVPVLVYLAVLRGREVRSYLPWLVMLILCLAMLPGDASSIAVSLQRGVPILGLSRFASSDYRAPLALALCVLATASFHAVVIEPGRAENRFPRARMWIPIAIFFFFVTGQVGWRVPLDDLVVLGLGLAGSVISLRLAYVAGMAARGTWLAATLALVVFSGYSVVSVSRFTWSDQPASAWYEGAIGVSPDRLEPVARRLTHPAVIRPARHDVRAASGFPWRGYLDGSYQMWDYTGTAFSAHTRLRSDPTLHTWMSKGWETRVIPFARGDSARCASLKHEIVSAPSDRRIRSVRYGLNDVELEVRLDEPALVAENESYFPGWAAELVVPGRRARRIVPEPVCEGVRTWRLPAGDYRLHLRYTTPYLRESSIAGLGVLVVYLIGVTILVSRRRFAPSPRAPE